MGRDEQIRKIEQEMEALQQAMNVKREELKLVTQQQITCGTVRFMRNDYWMHCSIRSVGRRTDRWTRIIAAKTKEKMISRIEELIQCLSNLKVVLENADDIDPCPDEIYT